MSSWNTWRTKIAVTEWIDSVNVATAQSDIGSRAKKNLEEEPSKSNTQTVSAATLGRMRYAENAIWHGRCSKHMMMLRNLRSHAEKAIWQEIHKMQFVTRDVANS